jgi:hypothetical protein
VWAGLLGLRAGTSGGLLWAVGFHGRRAGFRLFEDCQLKKYDSTPWG